MKQEILIGQIVDDGTGDYLRRGGQKTNNNFTELYNMLGDGEIPHPAGAWKTFAGTTLSPKFGESWALNTSANKITVNLPKGGVGDYNKVIRLRDVWSRWATNNVRLIPATGDTIKGSPTPKEITPFIVCTISKNFLIPEGFIPFTFSDNLSYIMASPTSSYLPHRLS